MRRFEDHNHVQYDELPSGLLRRRIAASDPSPHPTPQRRSEIEHRVGALREVHTGQGATT